MATASSDSSPTCVGSSLNGRAWRLRRITELCKKLERSLPLDMTTQEMREAMKIQEERRQELALLCEHEEEMSDRYNWYRDNVLEKRELTANQRRSEIMELASKKARGSTTEFLRAEKDHVLGEAAKATGLEKLGTAGRRFATEE
eukprot:TRINITY_DN16641_c0_g1_i1.p1 TRINITY_DN16641_c0_g1~~TRINITY_DN16641_c0_g1_i1.p1  ORF type:complete len:145 (+),score=29.62 TRINITY_DN16641_c0_g1_i1:89-523(+)